MASEGQVGQKEMKCILKFEKYFHMSHCYSGEGCGPWAFCFNSHTKEKTKTKKPTQTNKTKTKCVCETQMPPKVANSIDNHAYVKVFL
jgi:hypothetical protein